MVARETAASHASSTHETSTDASHDHHAANGAAADAAVKRMATSSDGSPVAPGNEIWVHRNLGYHHAGVYLGNNEVVMVNASPVSYAEGLLHGSNKVHIVKTTVSGFAKGDTMSAGPDKPAFSTEQVIARANARVGQSWAYDPVNHNCQTFASEVVTGHGYSPEGEIFSNAAKSVEKGIEGGASKIGGAISSGLHKIGL